MFLSGCPSIAVTWSGVCPSPLWLAELQELAPEHLPPELPLAAYPRHPPPAPAAGWHRLPLPAADSRCRQTSSASSASTFSTSATVFRYLVGGGHLPVRENKFQRRIVANIAIGIAEERKSHAVAVNINPRYPEFFSGYKSPRRHLRLVRQRMADEAAKTLHLVMHAKSSFGEPSRPYRYFAAPPGS